MSLFPEIFLELHAAKFPFFQKSQSAKQPKEFFSSVSDTGSQPLSCNHVLAEL